MSNKWETRGLALEVIGLAFILFAGAWQVFFTDWFDKQSVDSFYEQSKWADMSILSAVRDASYALADNDATARVIQLNKVSDQIGEAIYTISNDTRRRRALENGQAAIFKTIRFVLFALGSLLVLLGKWCVRHHKLNSAVVHPVPSLHPVLRLRMQKFERVSDKPRP